MPVRSALPTERFGEIRNHSLVCRAVILQERKALLPQMIQQRVSKRGGDTLLEIGFNRSDKSQTAAKTLQNALGPIL